MDAYHRPGYWPTRDGVIPFKMLVLASNELLAFGAELELHMTHAEAYGAALAFADQKTSHKLRQHVRKLTRKAYPEVPNGA